MVGDEDWGETNTEVWAALGGGEVQVNWLMILRKRFSEIANTASATAARQQERELGNRRRHSIAADSE